MYVDKSTDGRMKQSKMFTFFLSHSVFLFTKQDKHLQFLFSFSIHHQFSSSNELSVWSVWIACVYFQEHRSGFSILNTLVWFEKKNNSKLIIIPRAQPIQHLSFAFFVLVWCFCSLIASGFGVLCRSKSTRWKLKNQKLLRCSEMCTNNSWKREYFCWCWWKWNCIKMNQMSKIHQWGDW